MNLQQWQCLTGILSCYARAVIFVFSGVPWPSTKCHQAAERDQLYNFFTHAYVPQELSHKFSQLMKLGRDYEDCVAERINEMSACGRGQST